MAKPRRNTGTAVEESSTAATAVGAKPKPKKKKKPARTKGAPRECASSPSQRSSAYRGVTRHRWTGRFEAHLWDKDARNGQRSKKGKQVYLGAYDDEAAAARAYDLAALKYWGPGAVLNFPLCRYDEELKDMEGQPREEYIGSLRRRSSGFSRGVSKYRGVARHHHNGRWEARIGRVLGNKYLYLGTFATQEEAAVAYDIAAIEHRGLNAVTNFHIGNYIKYWRRNCCAPGDDGLDCTDAAAQVVPFRLPDDLAEYHSGASGLDDHTLLAGAAFHHGERQPEQTSSDGKFGAQLAAGQVRVRPPARTPPTSSPALDLLLRSPKFKEMVEQVSAAASLSEINSGSPSSSSSSSTPMPPPSPQTQPPEFSGGAPARCSFPDDVQTYFDYEDGMGFAYEELDTFLFGDLSEYAAPMLQCDLDV